MRHSLNETIAFGAAGVHLVALEDDLLKLTIRFEYLLEILLGDAKVDVANIETVKGRAVGTRSSAALGWSRGTILLCFCELGDDRNTLQFLAGQL